MNEIALAKKLSCGRLKLYGVLLQELMQDAGISRHAFFCFHKREMREAQPRLPLPQEGEVRETVRVSFIIRDGGAHQPKEESATGACH